MKTAPLAFTEAPVTMNGLMRQRFRWSFGTLQAVYKHQGSMLKNKVMGFFALPNILIFQILLPLFSPLIDLIFLFGAVQYFVDRHFHPETTSAASFEKLAYLFPRISRHRLPHLRARLFVGAPARRQAKATAGCSSTSSSSGSPTANSSPSSSSRPSSERSTGAPSIGTNSNARRTMSSQVEEIATAR